MQDSRKFTENRSGPFVGMVVAQVILNRQSFTSKFAVSPSFSPRNSNRELSLVLHSPHRVKLFGLELQLLEPACNVHTKTCAPHERLLDVPRILGPLVLQRFSQPSAFVPLWVLPGPPPNRRWPQTPPFPLLPQLPGLQLGLPSVSRTCFCFLFGGLLVDPIVEHIYTLFDSHLCWFTIFVSQYFFHIMLDAD